MRLEAVSGDKLGYFLLLLFFPRSSAARCIAEVVLQLEKGKGGVRPADTYEDETFWSQFKG